jgi:hypothetical protein
VLTLARHESRLFGHSRETSLGEFSLVSSLVRAGLVCTATYVTTSTKSVRDFKVTSGRTPSSSGGAPARLIQ